FDSADEVRQYFGVNSAEYLRALFYFGWISLLITRPNKISFARWAEVDTAPLIFGAVQQQSLSNWTNITDGAFSITLGSDTNEISGLDFSAATSLADVATVIQTALQLQSGAMWTASSVTYDASRGSFNLTGGAVGPAVVSVSAPATGTDILISGLLGWTSGAIFSNGVSAEDPEEAVAGSAAASSNFGSFGFMDDLTISEVTAVASWNNTQNNSYLYSVGVSEDDAADYSAALENLSGVALTEVLYGSEYPDMIPIMILAATDYTRPQSVQNYMYKQFALTPTVTTDAKATTLDDLRINYYGRTQTAGQNLDFYQRGVMMGLPTAAVDMNTYANEIWLKDAVAVQIMSIFLNLARIPANNSGKATILTALTEVIDQALLNGVFSVGKALSSIQKLYISQLSNTTDAWFQVQNSGYWVNCEIVNDNGNYVAEYLLIYAKDDVIRKVEGTHTLI